MITEMAALQFTQRAFSVAHCVRAGTMRYKQITLIGCNGGTEHVLMTLIGCNGATEHVLMIASSVLVSDKKPVPLPSSAK